MNIKSLFAISTIALFATNAFADIKPLALKKPIKSFALTEVPLTKLSTTEISQLKSIHEEMNSKILIGLNKNPKLKAQMQAEFDAINKMPDGDAKKAAISKYKSKYQGPYEQTLKAAGVDMGAYAKRMNAISPKYSFTVGKGMNFLVKPANNSNNSEPNEPLSSNSSPSVEKFEILIEDFENRITKACGDANIQFSSARFGVTTTTIATVAGGCQNMVQIEAAIDVPAGKKGKLHFENITLDVFSNAFGTIGAAGSDARAFVKVIGPRGSELYAKEVSVWSFAAVLFYSDSADSVGNIDKNINLNSAGEYRIIFQGYANAYGALSSSGAGAHAYFKEITYEISDKD